jgi:large subunit ribosomal protein L3
MVRKSKPRAGSLAFYPRKRARRIYPKIDTWPKTDKVKILGFSGYKVGMARARILDNRKGSPTQGQEITVPVTILECPPLKVIGIRAYTQTPNGLKIVGEAWDKSAEEDKFLKRKLTVGKYKTEEKIKRIEENLDKISEIRLIVATQPRETGLGKKTPEIFEITVGGNPQDAWNTVKEKLGKEIKVSEVFQEGEFIDTIAVTKGKGTAGPVKRFGVKIQTRKAHKKRRHVGALGSETPQRVLWTVAQAGQLGFQTRTEFNKRILKIGENPEEINPSGGFKNYGIVRNNYILVEGSVPGPKKRLIRLRKAIRPPKVPILATEIKDIVTKGA